MLEGEGEGSPDHVEGENNDNHGNHRDDDLSSRSQLLIEAFEILNIYFASTFATRPYQALTIKSQQDRQLL